MPARILISNQIRSSARHYQVISLQTWGAIILVLATLASACAIIYLKALQHTLYNELELSQQLTDRLRIERDKLLLEQNIWSAPERVQTLAQKKLGMTIPQTKDIVIVSMPH